MSEARMSTIVAEKDPQKRHHVEEIEWTEEDEKAAEEAWTNLPSEQPEDPVYPNTGILHKKAETGE